MKRKSNRYIREGRRFDASNTHIGDLLYKATQFRSWSSYSLSHGRSEEAKAHLRKYLQAVKSLRTLGFKGDI